MRSDATPQRMVPNTPVLKINIFGHKDYKIEFILYTLKMVSRPFLKYMGSIRQNILILSQYNNDMISCIAIKVYNHQNKRQKLNQHQFFLSPPRS